MIERLVVVSDLHIAPAGPLASFHAAKELAAFFQQNARADTTLVLAGDIFDFLQIEHGTTLDMPGAPELFRTLLQGLVNNTEQRAILVGLAQVLLSGASCIIMPGNHDPELHHPDASKVLLAVLTDVTNNVVPGDKLSFYCSDKPWKTTVNGLDVWVGHGHRLDPWNDIDPKVVAAAIESKNANVALPPGSRLVLDVLNKFKLAVDENGTRRFAFLDLLKPESPAVPLLLLYLDPKLALELLKPFFGISARVVARAFDSALRRRRQVLGSEHLENAPLTIAMETEIAEAIVDSLPPGYDIATEKLSLDNWLQGVAPAAPGMMAAHAGPLRTAARAILRHLSSDGTFFDVATLGGDDQQVVKQFLPEECRRVLICGHTHAARNVEIDDSRRYINTGTWMDLMEMPDFGKSESVEDWIDKLEKGEVGRRKRLTYAEVDQHGASLKEFAALNGNV